MEVVSFLAEQAVSLILGFAGGFGYHRYRLWKIKRHAPSAEVVGFQVTLTQEDYDRMRNSKQLDEDVVYMTTEGGSGVN